MSTSALPALNDPAFFIAEGAQNDHDDVNDHTNEEQTTGEKIEQAGPDFARVEPVNTQRAKENGEQQGGQALLWADHHGCAVFTHGSTFA